MKPFLRRAVLIEFVFAVALHTACAGPKASAPHREAGLPAAPVRRALLEAHNRVRAQVRVPPLVWSDELAQYAQQWADMLLARHAFAHRPHPHFGENLFERRGRPAAPGEVIAAWASEAQNYDGRTNTCHGVCGHYTQLVWRTTERLGCGVAQGQGIEVWVCNYDPPGNIVGERPY